MNLPIDLASIGFLSQSLQTPISKIRAAAGRLGIQESRLNGVAYFDAQAVELIRASLFAELRQRESHVLDQRSSIQ